MVSSGHSGIASRLSVFLSVVEHYSLDFFGIAVDVLQNRVDISRRCIGSTLFFMHSLLAATGMLVHVVS